MINKRRTVFEASIDIDVNNIISIKGLINKQLNFITKIYLQSLCKKNQFK